MKRILSVQAQYDLVLIPDPLGSTSGSNSPSSTVLVAIPSAI